MRAYHVEQREYKIKHKDGNVVTKKTPTFYLSYYKKDRKKVYENSHITDEETAKRWAHDRMLQIEGNSLKDFLERNNWFSDTQNPLYLDANSGKIKYNYLAGQSQRNTRYLEIIIKEIKDPISEKEVRC